MSWDHGTNGRTTALNIEVSPLGLNPFDDPLDRILAEIALSIQLPPSLHDKAQDRYEAVRRYLEATTEFEDQIEYFYPQGSMAIDGTISNRGTDDEYDLDIIAQLGGRFRGLPPLSVLLELEAALSDYPVKKVLRQTRCVTLFYADKMHLDVTPALRVYGTLDRESQIPHAKGPRPSVDDYLVDMNAYGFAEWYRSKTPVERRFAEEFQRRWLERGGVTRTEADVDEVPDQCNFVVKNTATLALQLIKRFRNIRYAGYSGRVPPSVMLSYYAGLAAQPNMSLSAMVVRLASWIVGEIERESMYGKKLRVENPICPDDVFTDRWPESVAQQNDFAVHLRYLIRSLERMRKGELLPDAMMAELRGLFGDRVVTRAVDQIATEVGAGIQQSRQSYARRGELIWPTISAPISSVIKPAVVTARPHTFFGRKI
jgi:hypothetical protein